MPRLHIKSVFRLVKVDILNARRLDAERVRVRVRVVHDIVGIVRRALTTTVGASITATRRGGVRRRQITRHVARARGKRRRHGAVCVPQNVCVRFGAPKRVEQRARA